MVEEIGNRTDEDIAKLLYPDAARKEEVEEVQEPETEQVKESKEPRSLDEIARTVYPPQSPRYARVSDDGRVASTIRDVEGNILHGGTGDYSDIRDMVQHNSRQLTNAALPNMDFGVRDFKDARLSGADLSGSTFNGSLHGSDLRNADVRGASFVGCNLRNADLRDIRADHLTDLEGADLAGAKYKYKEMTRCKNWQLAKNLRMDADK